MVNDPLHEYIQKFLQSHGINPTLKRLLIFEVFHNHPGTHLSLTRICQLLKTKNYRAAPATVLNTLRKFKNCGVIEEIKTTPMLDSVSQKKIKGRPEIKYVFSPKKA